MAERAPLVGVGAQLDVRQALQQPVADVHRIADQLQRQRVLGQAGDDLQVGALAEGEHQMVVADLERPGERRADEGPACGVDLLDAAHDEARAVEHLADRRDHVLGKTPAPTTSASIGLNVV